MAADTKKLPMRIVLSDGSHADIEVTTTVTVTSRVIEDGWMTPGLEGELERVMAGHEKLALEKGVQG